jgi:cell division protein FtsB
MEPMALVGMAFVLIMVAMIGGFILLIPLSRRLGHVLDVWLRDRKGVNASEELAQLRRTVQALEAEVSSLAERQQFTDELLQARKAERLEP